jgi:AraC-like DNA-binding protein
MTGNYPKIYLYQRIVQAKIFMDEFFGQDLDLDNISDEACFSKFHFIRLFKMIYGKTPHQYLTQVRINNAIRLLKEGNKVADTAYAVGFDSLTSFAALFKKNTSCSPSVFQQLYFERQLLIRKHPLHFVPACFAVQNSWSENSNFEEVR